MVERRVTSSRFGEARRFLRTQSAGLHESAGAFLSFWSSAEVIRGGEAEDAEMVGWEFGKCLLRSERFSTEGLPMSRRCSPTGDRRDFANAWIEEEFELDDEGEAGAGAIKERRFFTAVSGRFKSAPPGSPPTPPHRHPRPISPPPPGARARPWRASYAGDRGLKPASRLAPPAA